MKEFDCLLITHYRARVEEKLSFQFGGKKVSQVKTTKEERLLFETQLLTI